MLGMYTEHQLLLNRVHELSNPHIWLLFAKIKLKGLKI